MLRSFYRFALRLHPPCFRERFGEEMLSIFDQAAGRSASLMLLLDALRSLARQWMLRTEFWHDLAPTAEEAADGIPSFQILEPFRPRTAAVVQGLILSSAVFCATCFAIRYSWIHLLHVHIPEVQFESPRETGEPTRQIPSDAAANTSRQPILNSSEESQAPTRPDTSPGTPPARPQSAFKQSSVAAQAGTMGGQTHASEARTIRANAVPIPGAGPVQANPAASQRTPLPIQGNPARQSMPPPSAGVFASQLNAPPVPNASQATSQRAADCPAPCQLSASKLDVAERHRVIDAAARDLKEHYIDATTAQRLTAALLGHENNGDDDDAVDGDSFARLLTRQLRDVSSDMHLQVIYSERPLPLHPGEPTPGRAAEYRQIMQQQNCTFEKISILPHNIGYLKLNFFPDLSVCQPTATAAMASLNHAAAIIYDLRDNRGGEPGTVAFMAAYLFDHPEYWYSPRENTTVRSWTKSPVPGNKLADKPAYILTSAATASGAEQFCYNLKMLKRVTLVGETTNGAAHSGVFYRIDDHFGVAIPEVRPINPYSTTDWAEAGVEPDVKVKAADALATAERLAAKRLPKN
jgi:hypothetical protein